MSMINQPNPLDDNINSEDEEEIRTLDEDDYDEDHDNNLSRLERLKMKV